MCCGSQFHTKILVFVRNGEMCIESTGSFILVSFLKEYKLLFCITEYCRRTDIYASQIVGKNDVSRGLMGIKKICLVLFSIE